MLKLTVLKTLPPTDEVLDLNTKPARYEWLIYGSYIQSNPPADDPREDFILCNQGGGEGSGS